MANLTESLFDGQKHGDAPQQEFFKNQVYRDAKAKGARVPWDIGRAQGALEAVVEAFSGRVLDVGCGLGDNSLWLGTLPTVASVDAIDFSSDAIQEACVRQSSASSAATGKVTFTEADVFNLPFPKDQLFDCLLDSAVFHCIGDDNAQQRYLAAVTPHIKMGGRAVMLVFSDKNPDPWFGPRRISRSMPPSCGQLLVGGWTALWIPSMPAQRPMAMLPSS